jgi:hypothetical protein
MSRMAGHSAGAICITPPRGGGVSGSHHDFISPKTSQLTLSRSVNFPRALFEVQVMKGFKLDGSSKSSLHSRRPMT